MVILLLKEKKRKIDLVDKSIDFTRELLDFLEREIRKRSYYVHIVEVVTSVGDVNSNVLEVFS